MALAFIKKAVKCKNIYAYYFLGTIYFSGKAVKKSDKLSQKFFLLAIENFKKEKNYIKTGIKFIYYQCCSFLGFIYENNQINFKY